MKSVVVVHGGAGAPKEFVDGARKAAEAGLHLLGTGVDPLDAAIEAGVLLEDDPRFNAGTGSNLRLDGETIEMDAAVMNSDGLFGAVMALTRTKNPLRVARAVADTPHLMIAGDGATRLARRLGHADYDPATPRAREKHALWMRRWKSGKLETDRVTPRRGAWLNLDVPAVWNFPTEYRAHDTIGAVARDAAGRFAAVNSTGGTPFMLYGRVGDSPILGAGLYAGTHGAVAATGEGEEIVRRLLCYRVYERMAAGARAEDACRAELAAFPESVEMGLIAVGRDDAWGGASREMPFAVAGDDS